MVEEAADINTVKWLQLLIITSWFLYLRRNVFELVNSWRLCFKKAQRKVPDLVYIGYNPQKIHVSNTIRLESIVK